jgi:ribosome recycling factor
MEKAKTVSEDEFKNGETQMQKATDGMIAKIDELARKKEAELLEI